ncbi:Uncharacterised protein [uncultured archaeon]|nr:Uncharacterised protein [uncultured archaeon]
MLTTPKPVLFTSKVMLCWPADTLNITGLVPVAPSSPMDCTVLTTSSSITTPSMLTLTETWVMAPIDSFIILNDERKVKFEFGVVVLK